MPQAFQSYPQPESMYDPSHMDALEVGGRGGGGAQACRRDSGLGGQQHWPLRGLWCVCVCLGHQCRNTDGRGGWGGGEEAERRGVPLCLTPAVPHPLLPTTTDDLWLAALAHPTHERSAAASQAGRKETARWTEEGRHGGGGMNRDGCPAASSVLRVCKPVYTCKSVVAHKKTGTLREAVSVVR